VSVTWDVARQKAKKDDMTTDRRWIGGRREEKTSSEDMNGGDMDDNVKVMTMIRGIKTG